MDFKRYFRGPVFWIAVVLLAVFLGSRLVTSTGGFEKVDTQTVVDEIRAGNVKSARVIDREQRVELTLKNDDKIRASYLSGTGDDIVSDLQETPPPEKYDVYVPQENWFFSLLLTLLPIALIVIIFLFFMNQMQGGGSRVMNFGKSKAKLVAKDTPKTTFADVAGADEAVEELQEIKEFLASPAKFQAIGAKIPKGVLLYGPPGTGKTLLARAVAGEAGVPFYSISGSDFVEMFVGVGASRVRDLFEQAKANAPAIVFVDEIDAVGRHRGAGLGGGHDEREQTLNQLLVEMDGFDVKGGVILIAATNRPDILDPALLRPGRFDRQIAVERPDLAGRNRILEVHARGKPIAADVDLLAVARRTPGFTGADLANVLNEAALLTARGDKKLIDPPAHGRGDRPRRRRPAEAQPDHDRAGEDTHRLPRGRARARRCCPARLRPGPQDHNPVPRSRPGIHDGAAGRGEVLDDAQPDARPARLHARWARGRGAGVPGPDHRRGQRHREGHLGRAGHGHAVRDD